MSRLSKHHIRRNASTFKAARRNAMGNARHALTTGNADSLAYWLELASDIRRTLAVLRRS